jgi:hypothetical protein
VVVGIVVISGWLGATLVHEQRVSVVDPERPHRRIEIVPGGAPHRDPRRGWGER